MGTLPWYRSTTMVFPVACAISAPRTGPVGVARARHHLADPDLLRLEAQGEDEAALAADRRVSDAAQTAEHDDVAAGR